MRRVALIPAFNIKIDIGAWNVVIFSELEIIGKAAAGRWIDIRARNLGQYQLGGVALQVNVFQRTR